MATVFDDITLKWRGEEYTIPASRVLGAIARVEDVLTLHELRTFHEERGAAPLARISQAFGSLLRYAGAKVHDEEVYETLFTSTDGLVVQESVQKLMLMMLPPGAVKGKDTGKLPGLPATSVSSRKPTKR